MLPTERCGSYFVAEVRLDGRGPYRLLLDTGAPRTILSRRVAAELDVREPIVFRFGPFQAESLRGRGLESVEAGGFRSSGRIPFLIRDVSGVGRAIGMDLDGVLGYTVFDDLTLTYDFDASRVTVEDRPIDPNTPGVVPMTRDERPTLRARVGGRPVDLLIDTGFSGELALTEFDTFAFEAPPRTVGMRMRLDGPHPIRAARLQGDVELGPFTIRRPVVRDAVGPGLLGQGAMQGLVVALDRDAGLARLVQKDGAVPEIKAAPSTRGTGILTAQHEDHLEILGILPATPAAEAGLVEGDRIVAVDGVPVAERGCLRGGSPTDLVRLRVARDTASFEVALLPQVLVR